MQTLRRAVAIAILAGAIPTVFAQTSVTPPEKFFGHQLGADRVLARWDRMVEYYKVLEKESNRLKVIDMGPSTMGNPFLLVIVSSPANLARLEELRQINAKLSDPRGIGEAEIKKLAAEGRAVVVQSFGLHASEVAAAQTAPEFIYELASRRDADTERVLENVISIMIPCFNPDGQIMVADWYKKFVGTEYEAANLPFLYHKYVGHDNNRDAFQTSMVESQYAAKVLFRDWIPQAYIDHHQMGAYGARLYVPPYAEPIRPGADPLVWREMSWYGAHIAYKEEEANRSGIVNAAIYSGWGHFGFHWITPFHNIAGMLTESASARLATPLFLHPDQLQGDSRGLPEYEPQTTFPNPWPGGWWRVRDIVEQQKIAAWATLDIAARNRETVLWNAYLKAKRQTERGAASTPAAYVIPTAQHDPLTMTRMVNKLLVQGLEVHQARTDFTAGGMAFGAGSYVVPMAQPKMGVARYLLGRTRYPDNTYTRDRNGNPIRPYDMATDTMFEFMGVRVEAVDEAVRTDLVKVTAAVETAGKAPDAPAYSLDGRMNDAYRAVNLLLDKGVAVRRVDRSAASALQAGDFILTGGAAGAFADVAKKTGVDFRPLAGGREPDGVVAHSVKRQRLGLYQRYGGGNMDEGWTRWVLEQWGFPYTSIMDKETKAGGLEARYDVIILPSDSVAAMTGERPEGAAAAAARARGFGAPPTSIPPEYRSGFGKEGTEALKSFVQKGGTLVTFGEAGSLPIERFGLPLRNVVADRKPVEFWCPGSTLNVRVDNAHPLAYGMPPRALAAFLAGSQAYEIVPTERNEETETIVTFVERDILESGWLLGESVIAKKAAMVSVRQGDGRVVLIGFRPQHRAQTHGTFKVVFNALLGGPDTKRTRTTEQASR
ncbi:MAG TPA: M14 metallopeptidase family protein [Vicinamibacterales bacterium]|nr:M14 metallopeptidase family protein [Vicinamibacterales bacterium]